MERKFLNKLNEEIAAADKSVEISKKIDKCNEEIKNNNDEIEKLQAEFNKTLDNNIPGKISKINASTEMYENQIELLNRALKEGVAITPKTVDLLNELEEEYTSTGIEKLKADIEEFNKKYIGMLKEYDTKILNFIRLRQALSTINKKIDPEIMSDIAIWFDKKTSILKLDCELISDSKNEKESIRIINGHLDDLKNNSRRYLGY